MNKLKSTALLCLIIFIPVIISAAEKSSENAKDKVDYRFGILPALSFSADKGFGYGIIVQVDGHRDDKFLPYLSSHRIVLKRSTRGTTEYSYRFDSKYLLPKNLRITLKVKYQGNKLEPFHGFGGAQTRYEEAYTDSGSGGAFRGKFYYKYNKKYFRINTIMQGNIYEKKLRWLGGITLLNTKLDTINYSDFDINLASNSTESLLAKLQRSGKIDHRIFEGGIENSLLFGLV